jgi:starch-binding outer membrane protein, SusD/RagB family
MKMNKSFICSISLLLLFSCKKVIDVKETNFIAGDAALKSVANNEQGIIGAYSGMNIEMGILFNATVSDEVKKGEFYNSATVTEWQYTSTDITIRDNFTAFPLYYRIIDRVNRVLQALPTADSTRTGDNTLRSRLRGEALFLRAFCHFELFRYYSGNYDPSGLALAYLETPQANPQTVFPRITMDPYFTKLKADLAESKNLVPDTLLDRYRANRVAVSGLQARVALYTKSWADAVTYSTEYINRLPLAARTAFNGIWTDANTSEAAFKLRRTSSVGTRIGSLFRGTSTTTVIGTVTWLPSDKLVNSYDQVNDIRYSSYFKNEPLLTAANRPSLIIQKYAGTAYGTAAENVADAKVFRTGEMYLIRAEAKAELNDLAGAATDLNALRTARITAYTNVNLPTKEAAITAILSERFKELAYESHRFWDLKRRNLPVERLASDAPTSSAITLPAGNFRFILPIPNSEIQANSQIQQNPGYTN